jgi:hypothetical protein
MRSRSSLVVVAALLFALSGAAPLAQGAKPTGAATPQEAVAALQKATAAGDMMQALPVISPAGLKQIANEGVTGLLMVLAFSDPDDAMPGGPKPTASELAAKRKSYAQAKSLATQTIKPYGLDTLIGKPVLADDVQKQLNAGLDKADNALLITQLYASLVKIAPMLGMTREPKPEPFIKLATVSDYKINGDKATAKNGAEMLHFVRLAGRWYIDPPPEGGPGGPPPSGAPASDPPAGQAQAAAPRATASGKEPEVVIGGVQIVRVTVPDNDFSAKPFHADNGTTLVLWVKLPAGQGLIEIDDDASVLEDVGDDKGSNIGGKFGSFPEEFKDGSGGIIEIKSSGLPASGATAITAEGTLAMSIATGTRKTRVPKVSLANNAKFTLGKTPIVVDEVKTEDDSQTFTLKLPRQVMNEIKGVAFLDAKGGPIEGSRTSSGYMNDAAEMGFTVKTAAKVVTIEFEMWQGLKNVKVPFKVKTGLGF